MENAAHQEFGFGESGFTLTELLISLSLLLVLSASLFALIAEIQQTATAQSEAQAVLNNSQLALLSIGRWIRNAGNNPSGIGATAITMISPTEIRILSDITGSSGNNSDNGDPDGDFNDSGEDLTIRYNPQAHSIEAIPGGGPAQIIAEHISSLEFQLYDGEGNQVSDCSEAKTIGVLITGEGDFPDPKTHKLFGLKLSGNFQIIV